MDRSIRLIAVAFMAGVGARLVTAHLETADAQVFLLPWLGFVQQHGLSALGERFTNYTPFYTYCLLLVSWIPAPPMALIKSISWAFELATAVLGYRIAKERGHIAFAALWLAPTVIINGPVWGQADAIWAFFCLLSVYLFTVGRNGTYAFGTALAVKAQAAFLGPFAVGMLLKRREPHWLIGIPLPYLALTVPVLFAGRAMDDVLTIYLDQAARFEELNKSAANLWAIIPVSYNVGLVVGLLLATGVGLALIWFVAKSDDDSPEFILRMACLSMLLMPFLLPKMHERYFYGFEVAAIVLACINPRYWWIAVGGQISGFLAYMTFAFPGKTVIPGAIINLLIIVALVADLIRRSMHDHNSGVDEASATVGSRLNTAR